MNCKSPIWKFWFEYYSSQIITPDSAWYSTPNNTRISSYFRITKRVELFAEICLLMIVLIHMIAESWKLKNESTKITTPLYLTGWEDPFDAPLFSHDSKVADNWMPVFWMLTLNFLNWLWKCFETVCEFSGSRNVIVYGAIVSPRFHNLVFFGVLVDFC